MKALGVAIGILFIAELSWYVHTGITEADESESVSTLEQALYCPSCREIDPTVDGAGLCCGVKPERIDVRVRTIQVCSKCNASSPAGHVCAGAVLTRALEKTPVLK